MNHRNLFRKGNLPALGVLLALALASASASAAQAPRSGVDRTNFDPRVRPQDDLYRAIDGRWLERTPIPADLANFGAFTVLAVDAEQRVHDLLEKARSQPQQASPVARKAAALYGSFMDERAIELLGLKPLQPELARIDALQTAADVAAYLGYSQSLGVNVPLHWYVQPDPHDTTVYLAGLSQSGLTLPDRDYYVRDDSKYAAYRQQLRTYVARLLQLAGDSDADAMAGSAAVMNIEQRLAQAQWSRVQNRDPVATYNKLDRAALIKLAPVMDWKRYFDGVGAQSAAVNVDQPAYLGALDGMMDAIPVADWRRYLRFHLLDAFASFLPERFEQAHFEFHDHALSGVEKERERWKRGVALVNEAVGEISGQMYVEAWFPAASKQRTQQLVANLLRAFDRSIDGLAWMTPATRAAAHRKLAAINVKIGYPDKWRDYSSLTIEADDLLGNVQRAAGFDHRRYLNQLGKPVDRGEWHMVPQTVNAYYNPLMNEIVFPAAILQPPFFDPKADDAVNYGGIGAVIGHEISHGFDDSGRQFDEKGNLRDWWTAEDARLFKQRTAALVVQYNACTILDDQHVNGELTLGENIADLSGLAIAYKAWQLSLAGRKSPVIDGLTGPQRFFAGWAQVWRRNFREDNRRLRLTVDPHSPDEFRVNVPASDIDAFYAAFKVTPGDKLYRRPEERVRIW